MAGGVLAPPPHSTSANTHLPEIRVVVLGDCAVGKTSLLRQYLDHEGPVLSDSYESTLLDSYTHIEYCGKQPYRVHFTDCSSAPEFREHRAAYLAKCDVVLLVFSALRRKTLSNLQSWMKEVVKARTSTGPARFASTEGDFSEVPVFVVGTHYSEPQAAGAAPQKLVSSSEAESVTKDCLHSAGYFLDEDDAEMEEELRIERAAAKKASTVLSKKKQSPNAFRGFFADLFKGSISDDDEDDHHHSHHNRRSGKPSKGKTSDKGASAGSRSKKEEPAKDPPRFSPHSRSTSFRNTPYGSNAERLHGVAEPSAASAASSDVGTPLALPPGASPRLPLYMLSNDDGVAVNTAVRASLALHLWLKQLDDSGEVSAGVTPLLSPRVRSAAVPVSEATAHVGSVVPAELAPTPKHARTVSGASHMSHMSERSAAPIIPTMHALYGSVTSLSAFDTSYHHSCATSADPLTAENSPLAPGQPTQMLIAVGGDASGADLSSPSMGGKTSSEPYGSRTNAARGKGPLDESPWCSPTVLAPAQMDGLPLTAVATPTVKKVSPERSPAELEATANEVANMPRVNTEEEEGLVQADTAIFFSSPPNPRRATAPNTAIKVTREAHCGDVCSTPFGDYSAASGQVTGDRSVRPLPAWATADTPEPHRDPNRAQALSGPHNRLWKDVDVEQDASASPSLGKEQRVSATKTNGSSGNYTDSVVKKLALESEGKSAAMSPAQSPQNPALTSADCSPADCSPSNRAPRGSSPFHSHPPSAESSISTLQSPSLSPRSREQTQTHSRSPSHASIAAPHPVAGRSQTRPPQRDDDGLAKSTSLSASGSHSRAITKSGVPQKQKTKQCTTDGCRAM